MTQMELLRARKEIARISKPQINYKNFPESTLTGYQLLVPMLVAIKQTTIADALATPGLPQTLGYLYVKSGSTDIYFGSINGEMTKIATWSTAISWTGKSNQWYYAYVTRPGDLVWVFRGDLATGADVRQNPIVFPYDALTTPAVVDFGEGIKPTRWFQNSGIDYVYNSTKKYFIFAEYTRPVHTKAYVWKVTQPITDPANWRIVLEKDVGVDIEHFHTCQYDPWSGYWYVTSGDTNAEVKVWQSADEGETWTEVSGGSQAHRVTNYIFTKDYVYWGNDYYDSNHALYRIARTAGIPDFTTLTKLVDLPVGQATQATVYMHRPNGILLLDYVEGELTNSLKVPFYSLETNRLYILDTIYGKTPTLTQFGFLGRCSSLYQCQADGTVAFGFDSEETNDMALFNDPYINNLFLQLR